MTIRELDAAMTPGPWPKPDLERSSPGRLFITIGTSVINDTTMVSTTSAMATQGYADAAGIAALRNALPLLAETLEAAAALLEAEREPAYSWVIESRAARAEGRPNREVERMDRVARASRDLSAAIERCREEGLLR